MDSHSMARVFPPANGGTVGGKARTRLHDVDWRVTKRVVDFGTPRGSGTPSKPAMATGLD